MTHTLTIENAVLLTDELIKLINKSMPLKAKYNLNKLYDVVKIEKEKLNEFIKPYFSKDKWGEDLGDGQSKIKDEFQIEYYELIKEYLAIEISINFINDFKLYESIEIDNNENFPIFYNLFDAK